MFRLYFNIFKVLKKSVIIEVHSHIWYSSIWNGLVWLLGGSVWGVASCQLPATCQRGNQAFFTFLPCQPNRPPAGVTVHKYYRRRKNWFDCIVSFPILIWQRRSSLTVSRAVILRLIQRSSCRQKSIVLVVLVCWTWMNITPVNLSFSFTTTTKNIKELYHPLSYGKNVISWV